MHATQLSKTPTSRSSETPCVDWASYAAFGRIEPGCFDGSCILVAVPEGVTATPFKSSCKYFQRMCIAFELS